MIKIYKNFIIQEKYFVLVLFSFVLFWLRAINCEINIYNIGKLIVGLAINIPLFFLVSPILRILLKKLFGGKHKYIKLCIYIIVILFIYSAIIAERVYSNHSYLNILFVLITFHLWQPLLILSFWYLLVDRFNESKLTIKIIIFIIGICIFIKISDGFFSNIFSFSMYNIYDFSLLKVYYFHNELHTFSLYRFWWFCLTVLIIAVSDISYSQIGLDIEWNKKTTILTSVIICYIVFSSTVNFYLKYQPLTMPIILWNLLSSIYPAIEVSFFEEVLFRGIIQTYFCTKLNSIKDGNIIAIVISSFIFAIVHYPFVNGSFPSQFIHGLLFGWLYYKTQNLEASILAHGFNNFLTLAILR